MLRNGEDERIREAFERLREREAADAPSFARVVALARARETRRVAGWIPGLALACLAVAACVAVFALLQPPSDLAGAPGAHDTTNRAADTHVSDAPPPEQVDEPQPDDATAQTPPVESAPKKASSKPARTTPRRPRSAPAEACETC